MKKKKKSNLMLICFVSIVFVGVSIILIKNSINYMNKFEANTENYNEITLDNFTHINVSGNFEIMLSKANEQKVMVDKNSFNNKYAKLFINDDTLNITNNPLYKSYKVKRVIIKVNNLKSVYAKNKSKVDIHDLGSSLMFCKGDDSQINIDNIIADSMFITLLNGSTMRIDKLSSSKLMVDIKNSYCWCGSTDIELVSGELKEGARFDLKGEIGKMELEVNKSASINKYWRD